MGGRGAGWRRRAVARAGGVRKGKGGWFLPGMRGESPTFATKNEAMAYAINILRGGEK